MSVTKSVLAMLFVFMGLCGVMGTLTGCGNVALYQGVNADIAAVQTTTVLYQNKTISLADAKTIYDTAVLTEASLHLYQAALAAGTMKPGDPLPADLIADLQALTNELAILKAKDAKLKALPPATLPKGVTISSGDISALIQLVLDLAPGVISELQNAFSGNTITPAQITTAFTDLDNSLLALKAELAATLKN